MHDVVCQAPQTLTVTEQAMDPVSQIARATDRVVRDLTVRYVIETLSLVPVCLFSAQLLVDLPQGESWRYVLDQRGADMPVCYESIKKAKHAAASAAIEAGLLERVKAVTTLKALLEHYAAIKTDLSNDYLASSVSLLEDITKKARSPPLLIYESSATEDKPAWYGAVLTRQHVDKAEVFRVRPVLPSKRAAKNFVAAHALCHDAIQPDSLISPHSDSFPVVLPAKRGQPDDENMFESSPGVLVPINVADPVSQLMQVIQKRTRDTPNIEWHYTSHGLLHGCALVYRFAGQAFQYSVDATYKTRKLARAACAIVALGSLPHGVSFLSDAAAMRRAPLPLSAREADLSASDTMSPISQMLEPQPGYTAMMAVDRPVPRAIPRPQLATAPAPELPLRTTQEPSVRIATAEDGEIDEVDGRHDVGMVYAACQELIGTAPHQRPVFDFLSTLGRFGATLTVNLGAERLVYESMQQTHSSKAKAKEDVASVAIQAGVVDSIKKYASSVWQAQHDEWKAKIASGELDPSVHPAPSLAMGKKGKEGKAAKRAGAEGSSRAKSTPSIVDASTSTRSDRESAYAQFEIYCGEHGLGKPAFVATDDVPLKAYVVLGTSKYERLGRTYASPEEARERLAKLILRHLRKDAAAAQEAGSTAAPA
ncbi:uncharacterized protein L969DRAFT_88707 [Mixia osmundae IAM 14324]|nr:uncharacterized protein L969DRAFT_88707 [Mixia osmundae IAM 14324]KEI38262.1 hypothetical protein L969DRAFT_88707 [Mixia osmundae IAM 14324]